MANESEAATVAAEIEAARVAADAACRAWAAAVEAAARDAVRCDLPDLWFYNFNSDHGYVAFRAPTYPDAPPTLTIATTTGGASWCARVRNSSGLHELAEAPTIAEAVRAAAASPAWPWGRE